MVKPTLFHWLLLAYLVVAWGFAFTLIAVALEMLHPLTVVWARLGLGALVMGVVLVLSGRRLPVGRVWWFRLFLLSMTGNLLPFFLIAWAEQTVPSGEVGMLMALMPITTLLLAHWLLRDERLTLTRLLGVVVGFAGVVLLLGGDLAGFPGSTRISGQLATIVATLCYAANGIYTKRLPEFDNVSVACGSLLLGFLLLSGPVFALQPPLELQGSLRPLAAVVVLGVFATGFATWVYFRVVSDCGPGFLSTINYLIPGVAALSGAAVLGEAVGWLQGVSLLLILVGVWLIQPRVINRVQSDA